MEARTMADKKRGLGRSLQDMLSSTPNCLGREDIQLFYCPVAQLVPNPYQPRLSVEGPGLEELAASVREKGILQPLIVTRSDLPNQYQILAGERRWRAAQHAGLAEVPVLLRESTPGEILELALVENIQRQDLNCIEEAFAYKRLQEEFGLTQEEIARRVGRERSTVANTLRLLQLPCVVQELVMNGKLTMGHARALASLDDSQAQERLAQLIVNLGLSVRQAEQLAARAKEPKTSEDTPAADPRLLQIQDTLQARFGNRVRLKRTGSKGSITLSFRSEGEFQELLRKLGLDD
jgi:ParB family chromosome partitioning protein